VVAARAQEQRQTAVSVERAGARGRQAVAELDMDAQRLLGPDNRYKGGLVQLNAEEADAILAALEHAEFLKKDLEGAKETFRICQEEVGKWRTRAEQVEAALGYIRRWAREDPHTGRIYLNGPIMSEAESNAIRAALAAAPAEAKEPWPCTECGYLNVGAICTKCGYAPRPAVRLRRVATAELERKANEGFAAMVELSQRDYEEPPDLRETAKAIVENYGEAIRKLDAPDESKESQAMTDEPTKPTPGPVEERPTRPILPEKDSDD
jgi:hypothetical protein